MLQLLLLLGTLMRLPHVVHFVLYHLFVVSCNEVHILAMLCMRHCNSTIQATSPNGTNDSATTIFVLVTFYGNLLLLHHLTIFHIATTSPSSGKLVDVHHLSWPRALVTINSTETYTLDSIPRRAPSPWGAGPLFYGVGKHPISQYWNQSCCRRFLPFSPVSSNTFRFLLTHAHYGQRGVTLL